MPLERLEIGDGQRCHSQQVGRAPAGQAEFLELSGDKRPVHRDEGPKYIIQFLKDVVVDLNTEVFRLETKARISDQRKNRRPDRSKKFHQEAKNRSDSLGMDKVCYECAQPPFPTLLWAMLCSPLASVVGLSKVKERKIWRFLDSVERCAS